MLKHGCEHLGRFGVENALIPQNTIDFALDFKSGLGISEGPGVNDHQEPRFIKNGPVSPISVCRRSIGQCLGVKSRHPYPISFLDAFCKTVFAMEDVIF
jgi:hypothetical protein